MRPIISQRDKITQQIVKQKQLVTRLRTTPEFCAEWVKRIQRGERFPGTDTKEEGLAACAMLSERSKTALAEAKDDLARLKAQLEALAEPQAA